MATTCRVSFNVNVRTLRAGDALHVCVAEPGAGAAAVFDPARSVPLVRQEEAGGGTPNVATAADAPIFSVWCTPKPLTVPWGVQVKYKYCVFNGGAFAYWEKLSGDTRTLPSTTGKVRAAAVRQHTGRGGAVRAGWLAAPLRVCSATTG